MLKLFLCFVDGIGFMGASIFLVMVSLVVSLLKGLFSMTVRFCWSIPTTLRRYSPGHWKPTVRWLTKAGRRWVEIRLLGIRILVTKGDVAENGLLSRSKEVESQEGTVEESRTKEDSPLRPVVR